MGLMQTKVNKIYCNLVVVINDTINESVMTTITSQLRESALVRRFFSVLTVFLNFLRPRSDTAFSRVGIVPSEKSANMAALVFVLWFCAMVPLGVT